MHMHWKRKTSNNFPHLEHWTRQRRQKIMWSYRKCSHVGIEMTLHAIHMQLVWISLTRFLDTFWSQIIPKSNYRIVGCIVFAYDIGKNRTQFIIFKFYWGLLLSIKPFLTTLKQKGNCMYFVYFAINPKLFTATIWAISSFQFGKLFQHKHKNFL